VTMLKS